MRFVKENNAAAVLEDNNLFLNSANLQWKDINAFEMYQTRENHLSSYFIAHFNLHSQMFYIDRQHFGSNNIVSEQNYVVDVKSMQQIDKIALCFLKN